MRESEREESKVRRKTDGKVEKENRQEMDWQMEKELEGGKESIHTESFVHPLQYICHFADALIQSDLRSNQG